MARPSTAPAWRAAFLRELARSGSVALAARKVGIDRTSAYQARKRNPAFAASWERAQASARAAIGAGEPLRLRDDEVVRASKTGRSCVVSAGPGRWSVAVERKFLEHLVASANVKAAARAAGISTVTAYNRRRQWPAFAAAWEEALAEGYTRIETLLICAATATLDPEPLPEEACEAPVMTVDQAMKLWLAHRASVQGGKPQRYGWRRREPDMEEVRAAILRKVAALDRAQERGVG